ncbi:hypothetical protein CTEN210_18560 [Chaetoceros tenuissimus]|uniref:Uncharacterized protein n=1 Tax=Chaetoceros tenuissimus TaxID=426638 RepID=A0AAD3DG78_9STRA|nr:hypothetical protein CTEN210_18560 [Chaetoceros tenuissimus]
MIAFTGAGTALTSVSGSLSFISSCLIMIIILRSKQNTPYHRIMFFMSFWDSIASVAMALTTIPMPKDVEYDFASPSYGTTRTCQAQASIILFSLGLVLLSNIMLNVYYLCTIRYNVSNAKFRLRAEPIFLLTAIPLTLFQPIYYAFNGIFNPTPYFTFCMIDPFYPQECLLSTEEQDEECIVAELDDSTSTAWFVYEYFNTGFASLQFLVLCVTMFLIVQSARKHIEVAEAELSRPQLHSDTTNLAWQAFMYICACILTWIFPCLHVFVQDNRILNALTLFFFPMQGFFHLFIFLYHKVYAHKKLNQSTSTTALKISVLKPWEVDDNHEFVDNLEIIQHDKTFRRFISALQEYNNENMDVGGLEFTSLPSLPSKEISAEESENGLKSKDLSVQHSIRETESVDENILKNFFQDPGNSVENQRSVFSSPY